MSTASLEAAFLPYAKQSISAADIEAVAAALTKPLITRGPLVEEFEKKVSAYCRCTYAVAISSGTAALEACFWAAGVSQHDRILSSPITFVASVGPAVRMGAKPVYIDIDPLTAQIDLEALKTQINQPSSRGRNIVVPMHYAGSCVDMRKLSQQIARTDTVVIEDAAHAFGACYPSGEKVGSCAHSDMTILSLHPAKTITTGEGGVITTNSAALYERLRAFRDNGICRDAAKVQADSGITLDGPWAYDVQHLTGNYNFTAFQAALGLSQLARIDAFVARRLQLSKLYRRLLADVPFVTCLQEDLRSACHLFAVRIDFAAAKIKKKDLYNQLVKAGIGTQVHYKPLYQHSALAKLLPASFEPCQKADMFYEEALSLPLYADLQDEDVERVVTTLAQLLRKGK